MSLFATCYQPELPHGCRCGHAQINQDDRPENIWDFSIDAVRDEMEALFSGQLHPKMSKAEQEEYFQQLRELIHDAQIGRVRFASPETGKVIRNLILELKPALEQTRPAFNRQPYLLRLYFGEPKGHDRKLLGLKLAAKAPREVGLAEQDQHIDQALVRATEWAGVHQDSSISVSIRKGLV